MSRRERRQAKQNAKNFVPSKKKQLNKYVIVALAIVAAVFFIATVTIKYSM
ncbi:MAG: hypothetical protein LBR60_04140 [Fibrobacter sp.]|jgi:cell division protein FtsL|nr:hypothetical protein [Fibrobacter sp.]